MRILTLCMTYKTKPSEILKLDDEYTAFCFDEALSYILNELLKQNGKIPKWDNRSDNLISFLLNGL